MVRRALASATILAVAACVAPTQPAAMAAQSDSAPPAANRVHWPAVHSRVPRDSAIEARVDQLLQRMTVEEKVGQIVQGDISSVKPADLKKYRLGSILNGGNSAPGGKETAPAPEWLAMADSFWEASMNRPDGELKIPVMWGSDAVHGHSNIVGATLFPHNIGLGATRDPDLMRRIGQVTAIEMAVTGIDWDFSPTLAVVRDDRWGRTYEGFSEDPEVVRSLAGPMVEGLQGMPGTPEFLGPGKVIATAKHFVGDGGTNGGKDQGDNLSTPEQLRDIHGAGYAPAIEAGVQSVMASYSSVHGVKMHGNRELLTGALKEDMSFDGLVVGDWNAHGQLPGCSPTSCAASINAGLDMFMAPDSWKALYTNTLKQVRAGEIPMARLDDAVRRILRVKIRAGLFEKGRPSSRPYAGRFELLGAPDHRAVARQAVRESLVLLKNNRQLLPLAPRANVLVAGDGADDIAKQSGGWTITWQGTNLTNKDFPHAQSIFAGIKEAVAVAGGTATLSVDGRYKSKPDVAIVVFGEDPYAEFMGDRQTLEFSPGDKWSLDLLRRLKQAGIPVVAVFLSGRAMWVNPELNASDAFVAAFLPGSEGGGIADVLFRKADGAVAHDFTGKLSYSWPKRPDQTPLNRGDADYDPQFAFGYGLTYAAAGDLPTLSEDRGTAAAAGATGTFFARGSVPPGWSTAVVESGGTAVPVTGPGSVGSGRISVAATDRRIQEDARTITWDGRGQAAIQLTAAQPIDLSRETTGELSLVMEYRLDLAPTAPVTLSLGGAAVPITGNLKGETPGQWTMLTVPLKCFAARGVDMTKIAIPFAIGTAGRLALTISDIRITSVPGPQDVCGQK